MADFFFKTAPGQVPFSDEACTQAFEPSRPYPQNPSAIIYRARFKQLRAYYTKPTPNTPHPNLPQVYFVDDVDFQDKLAGLIEWTRIYSTLPNSWNDFASDAYTFPGLTGKRVPVSKVVTQKVVQDYFLVGTLPTFTNGIINFDNPGAGGNWGGIGTTVTSNASSVPSCAGGSNSASRVTISNSNGVHQFGSDASPSLTAGNAACSILLKAGSQKYLLIGLLNSSGPLDAWGKVDLSTGEVTSQNAGYFGLAAIGDGWFRAGVVGLTPNSGPSLIIQSLSDRDGSNGYQGNGVSNFYAWRGQLVNSNSIPHATVPPVLTPDGANYPVPNADNIPVKFGLQYIYQWSQNVAAEFLDGGTSPNINTYNTWVAADAANGNSDSYSIESADSTLSLWQGSAWQRQRHYVKAR